jgi:hypothetical protein
MSKDAVIIVRTLRELQSALNAVEGDTQTIITIPDYSIYYLGFGYIRAMAEELRALYPNIYDKFAVNITDHYALYSLILKSQFKKVLVASVGNRKIPNQLQSILSPREVYGYDL